MVGVNQLDTHLKQLDNEAKQHFVTDWWDTLEESIDGLLKLAVEGESKKETASANDESQSQGTESLEMAESASEEDVPFDEDRDDDYLVIDIIQGPAEAEKLYNLPLFRDSKVAKKNALDDLPPPPPEDDDIDAF